MTPGDRRRRGSRVPRVTPPTGSGPALATTGPIELRPDRHVAGGEAIARDDDGRVVFVRGALPGELVEVSIAEAKRDFARADVTAVREASADRVTPPCPMRLGGCGGCDWQHLDPSAQLEAKRSVVFDALRRTAKLDAPVVEAGASVSPMGYRTTIRVVGTSDGAAGYRKERSHETVDAAGCLVAHPLVAELLPDLRVTPGLEVTLRASVATGERTALWDPRQGTVEGLPADVATGADASLVEQIGHARLRVSSMSFFQSGPAAAGRLVEAVRRAAPELAGARHVVDLYGGVGLFAATVVSPDSRVTIVESSAPAAADARHNVPHARVVRSEVGRWRPSPDPRPNRVIDVVIADPSRTGLGKPGVGSVVAADAPTVVLVSCDAGSGARDVKLLVEAGYRHERSEVLDLFPQTHHVETVTRFSRMAGAVDR